MTTNQTIDGGLRALIETIVSVHPSDRDYRLAKDELRALLDAPADKPSGHCSDWLNCCCGGDTPRVREGCANWVSWKKPDVSITDEGEKRAAQPHGDPEAWTTSKPKAPGAYWIRGFNLSGEFTDSALVQVALEGDEQVLMVNLHQSTTEKDTAYWYEVGDINSNFEWLGPLHAEQPAPVAVVPDGYCIMPRQLTAENGAKALLLGEFKLLVTKECPECCELEEPVEGCSICDGEGEYGQKHTIPWDQIKFIYSKAVSGLAVKTESAKSR